MSNNNDCGISNTVALARDDVMFEANNDNRIVFASLYNYADIKDESAFKKIFLPPICVPSLDLFNMFYVNKRLAFSPYVLNTLVGSIKKIALIEAALSAYEEASGNSRHSLSAQQKILIRQELNTQQINNRVQRIVNLNQDDFKDAFSNEELWFDEVEDIEADPEATPPVLAVIGEHKNLSSVELHMYSDSLQMGFILVVQFISSATNDEITTWPELPEIPALGYENLMESTCDALACNVCVTYERTSV
jgi:hypothetical protein